MNERPYSYKPEPRFFGEGKVFLGVELEVEAPDNQKKEDGLALSSPRWAYAKRDGSLGIYGWEVVTHPIAVNYWMSRQNVRDYHNVAPGTVLTAQYKGETYTATMLAGGRVEWNGGMYTSISAAARMICGGKSVNGYRFFKLVGDGESNPVAAFFQLVSKLKEMGYESHDSERCGFHVHISREAFSDNGDLHNPMYFRFKCLVNGELFRKLSQRTSFTYCQQEPVTYENYHRTTSRYSAVNVTRKTVEVRIFRGNLREDRLRKNLEAVIAALDFAKESHGQFDLDYNPPTDESFVAYVRQHAERFQNLLTYIDRIPNVQPQQLDENTSTMIGES